MKRGKQQIKAGFTLVEILTAIAVIGILLALLVPALTEIQKKAQNTKQKAQFHGIEVALEAVYTDMGDYPPSEWDTAIYGNYAAPQRLAEALVGRDGLGLHSDTLYHEDGMPAGAVPGDPSLYKTTTPPATLDNANLSARKGPYLELESANAVTLSNLYGTGNFGSLVDSYVLADMYKITKNKATGKMTGSPILYYRANTNLVDHDDASPLTSTYNAFDATGTIASSGFTMSVDSLTSSSEQHPLRNTDLDLFYTPTANPNFTDPPRPYKSDSFILHSAGPDGLYGTMDDVFNFEK